MRRWARYGAFVLLGAAITIAAFVSARYFPGERDPKTGERQVIAQAAGEGPIYSPSGGVVEGRCAFVRAPGELLFYFDPEDPRTTVCVHPPDDDAEVGPEAAAGELPSLCARAPDDTVWCAEREGSAVPDPAGAVDEAYEEGWLPRIG